jgi:hypothetical protein
LVKKIVYAKLPLLLLAIFATISVGVNSNSPKLRASASEEATSVPPSLVLLGGGARWAAGNGTSALFVDWYDNWLAHHETDGVSWGPWPTEKDMKNWTSSISYALNQSGLNVQLAGDIPDDLSGYDVIVIHAYWAVEPRHEPLIRDFIANGGGVILLSGVPEYVRCYCKDWWTYLCPTDNVSVNMQEWLGADYYVNTGGYANVTVDNPFGTALLNGSTVIEGAGGSSASMICPHNDTQAVALWADGCLFAYTHGYGQGRVYYQASFENLDPPSPSVPLRGDVNADGKVDMKDIAFVAKAFGKKSGDALWNPNADMNNDGKIDMKDIAVVAKNFGRQNP